MRRPHRLIHRGRHVRWSFRRPGTAVLAVSVVSALLGGSIGVSGALAATTTPTTGATPTASPTASTAPATWYVDCSRKTNGNGTKAHPWNSVRAVNTHGRFAAGEKILLRRGTTCKGRLTPHGSGSKGHPILLGAYGHGTRPVVKGGGTPNLTGAVQLTNQHDWTVQDLHITNRGTSKA